MQSYIAFVDLTSAASTHKTEKKNNKHYVVTQCRHKPHVSSTVFCFLQEDHNMRGGVYAQLWNIT